jgi:hypothetical protein
MPWLGKQRQCSWCDEAIKLSIRPLRKSHNMQMPGITKFAFKLLGCTEEAKAAFSKAKELGH